jgi:hypothetical protein
MAQRIRLVDEEGQPTGKWFDPETAKTYEEKTRWDGSNHISLATGSQWNHETLFHTTSGAWVLLASSQWQGSLDSYTVITPAAAARWFAVNQYDDSDVPEELRSYLASEEV